MTMYQNQENLGLHIYVILQHTCSDTLLYFFFKILNRNIDHTSALKIQIIDQATGIHTARLLSNWRWVFFPNFQAIKM